MRPGAHHDTAATGLVAFANTHHAVDQTGRREVRRRNQLDQVIDGNRRVFQQGQAAAHHFAQVVRRDVGRHTDSNTGRAVDQQVRNARRQNRWLQLLAIVVRLEVDRFLVDIGRQVGRNALQAALRVTHGRRIVAVDGTEVTLTINQCVAQREILRHADQRIVDRRIAVRVVLTHDLADDAGTFDEGTVPDVVRLVHGVQHAAMHRLQAVARVRQRPADDHAHRVIEIGTPHLVFEADRQCFFGELVHVSHPHRLSGTLLVESSVICYFNTPPSLHRRRFS
ncbi:hypothetical protein SDC9_114087 [bioreactor metagenome]|uniref:Uncharacterized protein n=1 Tax=bioreactor metagenome TaxID=1076179 RepID=A0A645BNV5_9ZZZZ